MLNLEWWEWCQAGSAFPSLWSKISVAQQFLNCAAPSTSFIPQVDGNNCETTSVAVAVAQQLIDRQQLFGAPARDMIDDEEANACTVCLEEKKEVAVLHCRHLCLCRSCAQLCDTQWSHICPICRARVSGFIVPEEKREQRRQSLYHDDLTCCCEGLRNT